MADLEYAVVDNIFIDSCCYISIIALLLYDTALTFDREYQYIWKAKISIPSLLYLTIRYCTVINTIPQILELQAQTVSLISCSVLEWLNMVLGTILLSSVAVFSAMRIYAIYGRNKLLFYILLGLGMVNPISNFTCVGYTYNFSAEQMSRWNVGTRASTVTVDCLVLIMTWLKTYRTRKVAKEVKTPLTTVLLTDGTTYFSVLLLITYSRRYRITDNSNNTLDPPQLGKRLRYAPVR
ncbi:hypothetical protein BKA93DRAFT_808156 [Sparassis latifolia]